MQKLEVKIISVIRVEMIIGLEGRIDVTDFCMQ